MFIPHLNVRITSSHGYYCYLNLVEERRLLLGIDVSDLLFISKFDCRTNYLKY